MKKGYKMSKLGEIPVEWEVNKLGKIGEFSKGKGISKKELSKEGIQNIGNAIELMADAEGLQAHKNAVTLRLNEK